MTDTKDTIKGEEEVVVLKQDGMGRVRMPRERRERLLDEFERSGLSGKKFAELAGIKYQTFATWLQQRRRTPGGIPVKPADSVRWLEAVVEQAQNPGGKNLLVVQLPGGARVEIAEAKQALLAAVLLRALEQPATPC